MTTDPRSGTPGGESPVPEVADALWRATVERQTCGPVRGRLPVDDLEVAYTVQQRNVRRSVDELGWRPVGRKIGLTAPRVQAQLGVDQPDYGTLFAELTFGDGEPVPGGFLLQPRVEAEVALVLDADLPVEHPTVADVVRATAYAVPALEIVDSRITGWDLTITDTIADNASHGAVVLGTHPRPLDQVDVRAVRMRLHVGAEEVSTGTGADCLGNPLVAATWLARTMVERGTPLLAGDVVLTGALGPMHPVTADVDVAAEIEGLGSVRTRVLGQAS